MSEGLTDAGALTVLEEILEAVALLEKYYEMREIRDIRISAQEVWSEIKNGKPGEWRRR